MNQRIKITALLLALAAVSGCAARTGGGPAAKTPPPAPSSSAAAPQPPSPSPKAEEQAAPAPSPTEDPDPFADLRAQIPYGGPQLETFSQMEPVMNIDQYQPSPELRSLIIPEDPETRELAVILAPLGAPSEDFDSPGEAQKTVIQAAINLTEIYDCVEGDPSLRPLAEAYAPDEIWDWQFYPREHVEQNAAYLFGEEVRVVHQSLESFPYHAEAGVYTPPHRGVGFTRYPVILEKARTGEEITVKFCPITPLTLTFSSAQELADYIERTGPVYEAILRQNGDHAQIRACRRMREDTRA